MLALMISNKEQDIMGHGPEGVRPCYIQTKTNKRA